MLLGVLEGGGDLDGRLAFIPQVCGQTHQQTLAEADIGAVHEEDVVHVGQVCGQLRTLIVPDSSWDRKMPTTSSPAAAASA